MLGGLDLFLGGPAAGEEACFTPLCNVVADRSTDSCADGSADEGGFSVSADCLADTSTHQAADGSSRRQTAGPKGQRQCQCRGSGKQDREAGKKMPRS